MMYSYFSSQLSNNENSSTISSSLSFIVSFSFITLAFLLLFLQLPQACQLLLLSYTSRTKLLPFPEFQSVSSMVVCSDDLSSRRFPGCRAIPRYPVDEYFLSQKK